LTCPHLVVVHRTAQARQLLDAALVALEHLDDTVYGIVLLGGQGRADVVDAADDGARPTVSTER
jgi:hypothetical protein